MSLLEMSAFTAATISVSVAVVLAYLAVLEKESHLGLWSLGMAVYAASFGLDVALAANPDSWLIRAFTAAAYVATGALFWAGAVRFMSRRPTKTALRVIPIVVASVVPLLVPADRGWLALAIPALYLGATCAHSAAVSFRASDETGVARLMVAWAFVALGALTLVRPFSQVSAALATGVYLLTGLFTLAVGLGMLFMYLRLFRARIAEGERRVLRQSALLDQVVEGIIGLDADFNVTAWNRACERIYGLSAAEAIGRPVTEVVTSEFLGGTPEEILGDMGVAGAHSWLMRGRDSDGRISYFEVSGRRVHSAEADSEYVGVMRDVTERIDADAALRSSRERYRTLFESAPIPLWEEDYSRLRERLDELVGMGVTDLRQYFRDNRDELVACISLIGIRDVNETAVRLYGATSKDEFLAGFVPFLDEASFTVVAEEFASLHEGATHFTGQAMLHTLDGRLLDIQFTLSIVPGSEETWDRVLVSDIDLTRRTAAERELETYREGLEELVERRTQQLRQAYEDLQRATKAKDRLLANVSHEMRTPLNSIIGFTGVVVQGLAGEIPDEARTQLEMANRSGRQLLGLVNDLLDFGQLGAGTILLEAEPTDLSALVSSTCEMVRAVGEAKGLKVRCRVEPVPHILTDPNRVRQVLLNLLSNAMKYTEAGTIEIALHPDGEWLVVDVADTGSGIPEHERPHIFEAFYQLAPVRGAKNTGVGLGLAITRELAGLLGGHVFLESSSAQGSTFRLLLPIDGPPEVAAYPAG